MRVRIIFRGLTLFTFKKGSTGHAKDGDNMGELTAWLVSDPKMKGMPAHEHVPRLGTLARESFAGVGRARPQGDFPDEMRISLEGHQLTGGVTVAGSFLDYAPRLAALHRQKGKGVDASFITKKIVIPSGKIRAREFISWEWHGKTPARVAFMDTSFQGFCANEAVVDIGDDSDHVAQDKHKFVLLDAGKKKKKLWSYTTGSMLVDGIEPNMVEIVFTNAAGRRGTSLFWGLHMMTLFDAAGYPRSRAYTNAAQFDAFVKAALDYDSVEWQADREMMGIGHPFPFLLDPVHDKLAPLRDTGEPAIIRRTPPHPEWQPKGYGKPDTHHGGMHGMGGHPANDPADVVICPFGFEFGV